MVVHNLGTTPPAFVGPVPVVLCMEACGEGDSLIQTWGVREGAWGRTISARLEVGISWNNKCSRWREQHVGGPEASFAELKELPMAVCC